MYQVRSPTDFGIYLRSIVASDAWLATDFLPQFTSLQAIAHFRKPGAKSDLGGTWREFKLCRQCAPRNPVAPGRRSPTLLTGISIPARRPVFPRSGRVPRATTIDSVRPLVLPARRQVPPGSRIAFGSAEGCTDAGSPRVRAQRLRGRKASKKVVQWRIDRETLIRLSALSALIKV